MQRLVAYTACSIQKYVYIHIYSQVLNYSKSVKNLGITLDQFLSWTPQLTELNKKMFAALKLLRRLQYFLRLPTKALAQALLFPILNYADSCFLDLTEELERL